jgi:hypothetical protein
MAQPITTAVQPPHDETLEQRLDALVDAAIAGTPAVLDETGLRRDRVGHLHAFARAIERARRGREPALARAQP